MIILAIANSVGEYDVEYQVRYKECERRRKRKDEE